MNFWRRPIPGWFLLGYLVIFGLQGLVGYFLSWPIPFALILLGYSIVSLLLMDSFGAARRGRLTRTMAPFAVFAIEYDSESRTVLEALSDSKLDESWSFLVIVDTGVELWTVERNPQRTGLAEWSAFAGATITTTAARWKTGTVAIVLADGKAAYLDVSVPLVDRVRRSGMRAARLEKALNEHLTPAQPDPAHTQPQAQTG